MRNFVLAFMALVIAGYLGGCGLVSYTSMNQGTEIKKDQLAKIKPGMTKQDVLTALGQPKRGQRCWWQQGVVFLLAAWFQYACAVWSVRQQ